MKEIKSLHLHKTLKLDCNPDHFLIMNKIRIGIDIGAKGAVAVFVNDTLSCYWPFPLTSDRPDLHNFVNKFVKCIDTVEDVHVVMEDLSSIFGSSAKSNFQFGWINGAMEMAMIVLGVPFTKVGAKKWQKEMWEGIRPVENTKKAGGKIDTKATSLLAAKRLFPKEEFLASDRSRVAHNGIVDAVLMAEYCRRHF